MMSKIRLQGRRAASATTSASVSIQSGPEADRVGATWSNKALAFAIIIVLFGVLTAAASAIIVIRTYSPIIQWDQWIVVNELMKHDGHISLPWLWEQHNEHRIPLGDLACYADLKFFGGRNVSLLYEIYFIQAMQALFLTWMFR